MAPEVLPLARISMLAIEPWPLQLKKSANFFIFAEKSLESPVLLALNSKFEDNPRPQGERHFKQIPCTL